MADDYGRGDRQMFQGNWACSECGAAITELPFQPDPARVGNLRRRDCHRASRPSFGRSGGGGGGGDRGGFRGERKMFQGNWTCSGCGGKITELPFQPDPERADNLKCRDCFRKGREY